jgi:choline kinase
MKAIILAAGRSNRLKTHTEHFPKCLLQVGGKEILGRQLEALKKNNIKDVDIVIGYKGEKIREYCQKEYSDLNIKFHDNEYYALNNNGYSLYMALSNNTLDPFLLLNADTIVHPDMIEELLNDSRQNVLLVKKKNTIIEEDMKVVFHYFDEERIKNISKEDLYISRDYSYEFTGVAKFSNDVFIDRFRLELGKAEHLDSWFEISLNILLSEYFVYGLRTSVPTLEIDFPSDLEEANDLFPWGQPDWEHGRRHSSLEKGSRNIQDAMRLIVDVRNIFNKYNINYYVNWGLALGFYRDGQPIKHDTDSDLTIFAKDEELLWEKVVPELKLLGCYVPKREIHCDSDCFVIRDGEGVEINWVHKIDDRYVYSPNRCKLSCPSHHIDKLDKIIVMGEEFNIPSDTDNYLKGWYGDSWKTPQQGVKPNSF